MSRFDRHRLSLQERKNLGRERGRENGTWDLSYKSTADQRGLKRGGQEQSREGKMQGVEREKCKTGGSEISFPPDDTLQHLEIRERGSSFRVVYLTSCRCF